MRRCLTSPIAAPGGTRPPPFPLQVVVQAGSLSQGALAAAVAVPIAVLLLLAVFSLILFRSARSSTGVFAPSQHASSGTLHGAGGSKAPGLGPDTTLVLTDVQVSSMPGDAAGSRP
jgi:hypothetical protein